jgi:hypothetical protein
VVSRGFPAKASLARVFFPGASLAYRLRETAVAGCITKTPDFQRTIAIVFQQLVPPNNGVSREGDGGYKHFTQTYLAKIRHADPPA